MYDPDGSRRRCRAGRSLLLACCGLVAAIGGGCAILGVAANAMPQPPVKPKVLLAGQRVGVMVWSDRGTLIDWPTVQRDLSGAIQSRLIDTRNKKKAKELEAAEFPWPPESFVRWQRDHPDYENQPVTSIAQAVQVDKLIYVELAELSTRSSRAMALYRGTAQASIKVIDVPRTGGTPTVIYQEDNVRVVYPKHSSEEGRPEGSDGAMYAGTINRLADLVSLRFIEHPPEAEE